MNKITYNDDYKTATEDIFGNGQKWFCLEFDHHILKNRREELELTQQQVADKANINLEHYQCYEAGERTIASASMRIGLSICHVLKLDPYRFVYIS